MPLCVFTDAEVERIISWYEHGAGDGHETYDEGIISKLRDADPVLPSPPARRALRLAAGKSLREIGEAVEVTHECVRLWETGAREPNILHRRRYARLLDNLRVGIE